MVIIQNTQDSFVQLWLLLERTRRTFKVQNKRFCVRRILQAWFGIKANDDFIWEVCFQATIDEDPVCGWDTLLSPRTDSRRHREILRALVQVTLGLKRLHVKLSDLDAAYSKAFPNSTPLNVNKKKRCALQRCSGKRR